MSDWADALIWIVGFQFVVMVITAAVVCLWAWFLDAMMAKMRLTSFWLWAQVFYAHWWLDSERAKIALKRAIKQDAKEASDD